jgi:hypothetical protein
MEYLFLSTEELMASERYWVKYSQECSFPSELTRLKNNQRVSLDSCLKSLNPFIDEQGLIRVGGRQSNTDLSFSQRYPVVLHSKHSLVSLITQYEHLRLLHAGPTLLTASLNRRYHIIGIRRRVRSITRSCIICRRTSVKPHHQKMGKLPSERITPTYPEPIFSTVGVDYAGPVRVKSGPVRKPILTKAYICVFVAMSVKAVHIEVVSDLTTEAFLSCLRRFIARRSKPRLIMSDHGTNFVGANRELKILTEFLQERSNHDVITRFCSSQAIQWKFIPERAPHFGGIWEAAVKSLKTTLKRVIGDIVLNFEELTTILTQIEACLNSRPLTPVMSDDDGIEALTPWHFLIGQPLEAIPDSVEVHKPLNTLRRWCLCQAMLRTFWKRWSTEYLVSLHRYNKWQNPTRNFQIGDVVIVQDDALVPCKWPLGRIVETHQGKDGLVRVVTVKMTNGIYKRPVTKIALLLPEDE